MALHEPFGHLQHKLWSKEGSEVKLAVWLPTTKNRESTRPRCVQVECNKPLESYWGDLQVCFIPIRGLSWELWAPKVSGVQTGTVSGLFIGSPRTKSHLDVGEAKQCREYYMGEGGGFPWIWAVVSQMNPCCPWLVPTPRVLPKVN
jgi:hypothetical protein